MAVPFETWLAFVAATIVLVVVPGPTALLVIGYGLAEGRRSVAPTTAGVVLGDLTALTGAGVGVGALFAASAVAFSIFKWAGALYLIFLGVRAWRAPPADLAATASAAGRSAAQMLRHAYVVTALNPKTLLFFMAFLPQFVAPDAPPGPQFKLLGATFLVLGGINAAAYGLLADRVRGLLGRGDWQKRSQRAGAAVLIAAGLLTATLRQPA